MATEAIARQYRLHILVEIKMLRAQGACVASLPVVTTHRQNQQCSCQTHRGH
jgi:hypothetical protein